jgi:hypothetical protein
MPLRTNLVTRTLVLIFCNIISYFYKMWLIFIFTKSLAYFFLVPYLYFSNSYSSRNIGLSKFSILYLGIPSTLIVLFNKEASRHIGLLEKI